jgi:hypothetical protein
MAQPFIPAAMRRCTSLNSSADRMNAPFVVDDVKVSSSADKFVGEQGGTIGWPRAWWNWLTRRL